MRPGNRWVSLIFPASAILTERSGKNGAGIGINEQFWDLIFRHPACVRVDDRFDVRRFTCDWNLTVRFEQRNHEPLDDDLRLHDRQNHVVDASSFLLTSFVCFLKKLLSLSELAL